jgi:hypothetical protein
MPGVALAADLREIARSREFAAEMSWRDGNLDATRTLEAGTPLGKQPIPDAIKHGFYKTFPDRLGNRYQVQPRIKKKKRRIGIGTPRSHRRIQPNFPP